MIALIWPLVFLFTGILYILILITLPFNQTAATVFLFTLIAFWSRLPGVSIPAPLWILYVADVIDVLAMIVAINLGGIYGGLLSLFANLAGRLCGTFTPWGANISDAIAMFFACLLIPFVHVLLGSNLLISVVAFLIIRILFLIPLDLLVFYQIPLPQYIIELFGAGAAILFINSFYTKIFGGFFDGLLKAGVSFSWPLFLFATIIIITSYLLAFGFSEKVPLNYLKAVRKKVKKKERKITKNPDKSDMEFIREIARK